MKFRLGLVALVICCGCGAEPTVKKQSTVADDSEITHSNSPSIELTNNGEDVEQPAVEDDQWVQQLEKDFIVFRLSDGTETERLPSPKSSVRISPVPGSSEFVEIHYADRERYLRERGKYLDPRRRFIGLPKWLLKTNRHVLGGQMRNPQSPPSLPARTRPPNQRNESP